jgi:hypothetical protein
MILKSTDRHSICGINTSNPASSPAKGLLRVLSNYVQRRCGNIIPWRCSTMNIKDVANLIIQAFNDSRTIYVVIDDKECGSLLNPMINTCCLMNENGFTTNVVAAPWSEIVFLLKENDLVIFMNRGINTRSLALDSRGIFYVGVRPQHKKLFEDVVPRIKSMINEASYNQWEKLANG